MFDSLWLCASAFQSIKKPQLNVATGDTAYKHKQRLRQAYTGPEYKYEITLQYA